MEKESVWMRVDWGKGALAVSLLFFLINLLFLDYHLFGKKNLAIMPETPQTIQPVESEKETIASSSGEVDKEACPVECVSLINESEESAGSQKASLLPPVYYSGAKEVYIPLGSGSTKSEDYEELAGVEAVVDLDNYPQVKEVIFEATMKIPTANGKAYAKLYNVTDKHDAWNSETWAEGSSAYRGEAEGVSLASGRKLYRVKMKSTMGYEAVLDSARIKIILE